MRQICLFLFLFLILMAGCQNSNKGVQVTLEETDCFPDYLVGKWKAEDSVWEFEFDSNGNIQNAIIDLAHLAMVPGQTREFKTKTGGKGVFEPGLWTVRFNNNTRELEVVVDIKHFYEEIGTHSIEGSQTDTLLGQISEDNSEWEAVWLSRYVYIANVPEKKKFDEELEPVYKRTLIFKKLDD